MTETGSTTSPKLSPWAQWVLRGLLLLGGASSPRELERRVARELEGSLSQGQIARILKNNYLRWASVDLRKLGLLGGEFGTWELTTGGRQLAEARLQTPIEVPTDIEELPPEQAAYDGPTVSVSVTSFEGYRIPVLRALESGPRPKQDLFAQLESALGASLLPGDRRLMANGMEVWRYRASWSLTTLKKEGLIRNDSQAVWEITDAGRARLQEEARGWSLAHFQSSSKATVRAKGVIGPNPERPEGGKKSEPPWPTAAWLELHDTLPPEALRAVERRLRPDLGPTPELSRGTLPRNIVFYGPPGTGKTFIASRVAKALTEVGDRSEDGAWRLVQFHPSYSYEDFVQGMRPDLKQRELRYELRKGPFVTLCEAASEDPDGFYVMVIDEINRGDPARIFGELLYALEYRDEPVDLALGGQLIVPPNVVVIGTMNSVDRSVALVDYALRRRFAFVRLDPDPEAIRRLRGDSPAAGMASAALARLNEWLTSRLDREHAIGHSFFLNPAIGLESAEALQDVWREDLLPLLEEYFVGDPDGLLEARRVWERIVGEVSSPAS